MLSSQPHTTTKQESPDANKYTRHQEIPGSVSVEVRLFPDDGDGFSPVDLYADVYGERYLWADFDWQDRLKTWGTARETANDTGVRLPEVRVIFRWTKHDRWIDIGRPVPAYGYRVDVDYYLDIPLWRTSNAMNKMERCSDALVER